VERYRSGQRCHRNGLGKFLAAPAPTGPVIVGTLVAGACRANGTGFTVVVDKPASVNAKGEWVPVVSHAQSNETGANCR